MLLARSFRFWYVILNSQGVSVRDSRPDLRVAGLRKGEARFLSKLWDDDDVEHPLFLFLIAAHRETERNQDFVAAALDLERACGQVAAASLQRRCDCEPDRPWRPLGRASLDVATANMDVNPVGRPGRSALRIWSEVDSSRDRWPRTRIPFRLLLQAKHHLVVPLYLGRVHLALRVSCAADQHN